MDLFTGRESIIGADGENHASASEATERIIRTSGRDRARRLAARQGGRIPQGQLIACGFSPQAVKGAIRRGDLVRTRPHVYALGYPRDDVFARTWEAVLYAGPVACLTGGAGCYEAGLISYRPPDEITVATARKCASLPGIRVLDRRRYERVIRPSGLPVAPTSDLLLDLAASMAFNVVRHALAQLDYRHELDIAALRAACRRGRPGSRQLRRALSKHLPQLARCRSDLEVDFLLLLEAHHLPMPLVNHVVNGIEADMYWPDLALIVELDGGGNHHSAAQKRRDAGHDAHQRAHGLTVIRLDHGDVHGRGPQTLGVLSGHGVRR